VSQLAALLRKDARVVYRDGFLAFLPLYAVLLPLAGRFLVAWLPVADLGLYLAPAIVLTGALMLGNVLGFALIEERERGTWLLLRVLPVGEWSLLVYHAAMSSFFAFCLSLASALAYGHPVANVPAFFVMAAISSLTAPIVMFVLALFASNKIEGLAVTKLFNLVTMVPALVFVLPMPWQLLAAWCRWYWAYLGLLEAYAGDPRALSALHWPDHPLGLSVAASGLLSATSVLMLARRYARKAS
jgi:fluoroquinolone transport system permease protein